MIGDRSFEEQEGAGLWSVEEGALVQRSMATNVRLTFGNDTWRDYEMTVEARKTGGSVRFFLPALSAGVVTIDR